jgi:hypothetical protein
MENVRFRQVVHPVRRSDGDGGWKFPPSQTVEKQEPWDIPANRLGLETGQRFEALVDLGETRDAIGSEVEDFDSLQEMIVRITLPARLDALVEPLPRLVIFRGVQLILLFNIQFTTMAGLLDEGGMACSKPGSRDRLSHSISTLPRLCPVDNL